MRRLTLSDLKAGLDDLLTTRRDVLERSVSGRIYLPMLDKKKAAIDALPEALTAGYAQARDLAEADAVYDGLGKAIHNICAAYMEAPGVSAEVRAAAQVVQAAFVPSLAELHKGYAEEAADAEARRPQLEALASELAMLPIAGGTLADWAQAFVDQGKVLEGLLAQRDQYMEFDQAQRREAGGLRATTITLLENVRKALRDEAAVKPSLANAEAELFEHFDELASTRAE